MLRHSRRFDRRGQGQRGDRRCPCGRGHHIAHTHFGNHAELDIAIAGERHRFAKERGGFQGVATRFCDAAQQKGGSGILWRKG